MRQFTGCALAALGAVFAFAGSAVADNHGSSAPTVVIDVRRDASPGGRNGVFPDVGSALASIQDASPAKPYTVRLAPGVYPVPAPGLGLKPFVVLEGDGAATTVLEGTIGAGWPLWVAQLPPEQPAVVRMASNSRLRRLTVRNTSAEGGIAVYFPGTSASGAEDVVAEVLGRMGAGVQHDYHAIRVQGPGSDVTLDRVTARYLMETPADAPLAGDNVAVAIFGPGRLLVRNSRAIAENGWWNVGIVVEAQSELTVLDSAVEVSGRAEGSFAFSNQRGHAEFRNTTMTVTCPPSGSWGCAAIYGCEGPVAIHGGELRVIPGARASDAGLLRCRGTATGVRLAGPAAYDDWVLVDCIDGESRPIPNRP